MQFTTLIAATLAAALALAIPPEDFGFPSAPNDTALGVTYNTGQPNEVLVMEGMLLGPDVPAMAPTLTANKTYSSLATYSGSYLALMVDPDARTPNSPTSRFILHWMAPNLTANPSTGVLTNSTPAIADYARPMPPPTSDPHRYIFYLFSQPGDFAVPDDFSGYGGMNRSNFNLTTFIDEADLMQPMAAMYFFCQNKTDTPGTFTAAPGGMFPGGNGGAITAGPGPSVMPTTSMMGGEGSMSSMSSMMGGSESTMASTAGSTAGAAAMATGRAGAGAAVMAGLAGGLAWVL